MIFNKRPADIEVLFHIQVARDTLTTAANKRKTESLADLSICKTWPAGSLREVSPRSLVFMIRRPVVMQDFGAFC